MDPTPSPFKPPADPAAPILQGDPAITDEQRVDLWDIFHNSKDPNELAKNLTPVPVPDDTKHRLWQAKQNAMPAAPVDKTTAIIKQMAQMDPQELAVAEQHPNVLKALTAAATTPEKEAGDGSGASKGSGKGNTASGAKKPATASPDVPATPPGHALIQASDGGLHHIPLENLTQARGIDPAMTVLHVEP